MGVAKQKKKKINKTRTLFILCLTVVPVANFLIFYVYVNFSSILMAFKDSVGNWSLENFTRFFEEFALDAGTENDMSLWLALKNTMLTFAIILASYPFKVLVSYFIYKKVPFAGFYRIVFFLPSIIFSVAMALIFQQLVGVKSPIAEWVGSIAGTSATPDLLADSRFANATVILHMMWLSFPGDLVIWGGTFAKIPEEVIESARIDGVNWWTEFTKITVPLVWPTVALQMILLFCGMFGASGSVFLLTEGQYKTITLSAWMYLSLYGGSLSYNSNVYNYLAAVGLLITAVAIAIALVVRKQTDKFFTDVEF